MKDLSSFNNNFIWEIFTESYGSSEINIEKKIKNFDRKLKLKIKHNGM